jgi:hypothetical protein
MLVSARLPGVLTNDPPTRSKAGPEKKDWEAKFRKQRSASTMSVYILLLWTSNFGGKLPLGPEPPPLILCANNMHVRSSKDPARQGFVRGGTQ